MLLSVLLQKKCMSVKRGNMVFKSIVIVHMTLESFSINLQATVFKGTNLISDVQT